MWEGLRYGVSVGVLGRGRGSGNRVKVSVGVVVIQYRLVSGSRIRISVVFLGIRVKGTYRVGQRVWLEGRVTGPGCGSGSVLADEFGNKLEDFFDLEPVLLQVRRPE